MNPIISIVLAVRNGGTKIRQSIESMLNQTLRDFEFIIVDDASTDDTAVLLAEYAKKDPRIKILSNKTNLGLTKSLNVAIKASSGMYIARLDSGDTSEPQRLALQATFLDEYGEYGLVGAWTYVIDEEGKRIGKMKYAIENDELKRTLIKYNQFVHSSLMVRKSALDAIGGYDEQWCYAQDYDLCFRIAKHWNIANYPNFLASYRISSKSITSQNNKKQTLYAIRARVRAIKSGQYAVWTYVFLLRPLIGYLLPYWVKRIVMRLRGVTS